MVANDVFTAQVDHSTPLVLELNEITVLIGVNALGIIAIMTLSVFIAASAFFGKNS